jgi:hypothetical protein
MLKTTQSLLLAALMTAAGFAAAQTSPAPSTTKPGEATTMQGGVPNPTQKPANSGLQERVEVRQEAVSANRTGVGTTKGEASTNVKGNPNMPDPVGPQNTRSAVRAEGAAAAAGTTARNSPVPTKAGEASTMGGGQPNVAPAGTTPSAGMSEKTRAEVRAGAVDANAKTNTTTK